MAIQQKTLQELGLEEFYLKVWNQRVHLWDDKEELLEHMTEKEWQYSWDDNTLAFEFVCSLMMNKILKDNEEILRRMREE